MAKNISYFLITIHLLVATNAFADHAVFGRLDLEFQGFDACASTPADVGVLFPATSLAAEKTLTLQKKYCSGGLVVYSLDTQGVSVRGSTDHPFVNHPDQWDVMHLYATSGTLTFNELRVTKYVTYDDQSTTIAPWLGNGTWQRYYHFVLTPNATEGIDANGDLLYFFANGNFQARIEENTGYVKIPGTSPASSQFNTLVRNDGFNTSIILTSTPFSLEKLIRERREKHTVEILNTAPEATTTIEFNNLPMIIREAAYDIGQSGMSKFRPSGPIGGCSTTQVYYQINYSEEYTEDFPTTYECDNIVNQCWLSSGIDLYESPFNYPWPSGIFADGWDKGRDIAQINFSLNEIDTDSTDTDTDDIIRTGIIGFEKIELVESGRINTDTDTENNNIYIWSGTGETYIPKPGDSFWRNEQCQAANHAMTLVGTPAFDSMGTPDITDDEFILPVFDGPVILNIGLRRKIHYRMRTESTIPLKKSNDTENKWGDWLYDATIMLCDFDNNGCIDRDPTQCTTEGLNNFLYNYYIGQSITPVEWYISTADTISWNRIGQDIFTVPVNDNLKDEAGVGRDPIHDELRFADFNGDHQDDIFWVSYDRYDPTANHEWYISYSCNGCDVERGSDPNYNGWFYLGGTYNGTTLECVDIYDPSAEPPLNCSNKGILRFGDFGDLYSSTADGMTDIAKLMKHPTDSSKLQLRVKFSLGEGLFSNWQIIREFTRDGAELKFWVSATHFADFNGDGTTDTFARVSRNGIWTWLLSLDSMSDWIEINTGDSQSLSDLGFVDVNMDGKTDIIAKGSPLNRWFWKTLNTSASPIAMTSWDYVNVSGTNFTLDETASNLRFGDFDDDLSMDVFRLNTGVSPPQWLVSFGFENTWQSPGTSPSDLDELHFIKIDDSWTQIFVQAQKNIYRGRL